MSLDTATIENALNRERYFLLKGRWHRMILMSYRLPGFPAHYAPNPWNRSRERPGMSDAEWAVNVSKHTGKSGALFLSDMGAPFTLDKASGPQWYRLNNVRAIVERMPDEVWREVKKRADYIALTND